MTNYELWRKNSWSNQIFNVKHTFIWFEEHRFVSSVSNSSEHCQHKLTANHSIVNTNRQLFLFPRFVYDQPIYNINMFKLANMSEYAIINIHMNYQKRVWIKAEDKIAIIVSVYEVALRAMYTRNGATPLIIIKPCWTNGD